MFVRLLKLCENGPKKVACVDSQTKSPPTGAKAFIPVVNQALIVSSKNLHEIFVSLGTIPMLNVNLIGDERR